MLPIIIEFSRIVCTFLSLLFSCWDFPKEMIYPRPAPQVLKGWESARQLLAGGVICTRILTGRYITNNEKDISIQPRKLLLSIVEGFGFHRKYMSVVFYCFSVITGTHIMGYMGWGQRNMYHKISDITCTKSQNLKCFSSRLAVVFAQYIVAKC